MLVQEFHVQNLNCIVCLVNDELLSSVPMKNLLMLKCTPEHHNHNSKKSGIVELGGGVPKNTAQQTGPLLDQILQMKNHGRNSKRCKVQRRWLYE